MGLTAFQAMRRRQAEEAAKVEIIVEEVAEPAPVEPEVAPEPEPAPKPKRVRKSRAKKVAE